MTKASDLRIGNRINGGVIVIEVHSDFVTCCGVGNLSGMASYNDYEIHPIELTEEWLLKFGFIKNTEIDYRWCFGDSINTTLTIIVFVFPIAGSGAKLNTFTSCKTLFSLLHKPN